MALSDVVSKVSGLFGKNSTPQTRRQSVDLDLISPDNVPDGALAAYYELLDNRTPNTVRLIKDSYDLRAGLKRAAIHPNFSPEDRENYRADGPEKYDLPRDTARRLGQTKAEIKRPAAGLAPLAQKQSSRIEQFDNGLLAELYPDMAVVDCGLNEGVLLTVQTPLPSAWEVIPCMYDDFEEEGEPLGPDEYDALSSDQQNQYAPTKGKTGYKRIRSRYRVNSAGEQDDGSSDFVIDLKASAKYYADEKSDAYARHIPIKFEGPFSRLDYVPINPVFSGKKTEVDGVIIRTLFRRSKLKRLFRYDECDTLLEPVDRYDGTDGDFYLYRLFAYDEMRRPYIAYQVGKRYTTYADGSAAVIKLWEEYPGCTELPISFEYARYNFSPNPDRVSMPFTTPRQQSWLQRDATLTTLAVSSAVSAYPTWVQEMTQEGLALAKLSGDVDLAFKMEPLTVKPAFGKLIEVSSKGPNPAVEFLIAAHQSLSEKGAPPPGVFGGEGPTSGLDRQVEGRDMEVAHGDVIEAYRRNKEANGRHGLMLSDAMGKKAGRPVELYVMDENPSPQAGVQSSVRTRVTLPPGLCGDNWDVIAKFPHQPGENLAATSLYLTLMKEGAILEEEFRELWGDPSPELFAAKKQLQAYFASEAGSLDLIQGMAEYLADQKLQKTLAAVAQGKVTSAQGGASTALMQSIGGGAPPGAMSAPGGAVAGSVGLPPNPGMQSLAGGNAGALQASAASGGSPIDGTFGGGGMVR